MSRFTNTSIALITMCALSLLHRTSPAQGQELFVSSRATNHIKQYDGTTGAFLNNFITSGSGGLSNPSFLAFRPVPAPSALFTLLIGAIPGACVLLRRRRR